MDYSDDEVLLDWEQYSGTGSAHSHYYVQGDMAKTSSLRACSFSIAGVNVSWMAEQA